MVPPNMDESSHGAPTNGDWRGAPGADGRFHTPSGRPGYGGRSGDGVSGMAGIGGDEGRTLSQRLRRSAMTYKEDPIPTKVCGAVVFVAAAVVALVVRGGLMLWTYVVVLGAWYVSSPADVVDFVGAAGAAAEVCRSHGGAFASGG